MPRTKKKRITCCQSLAESELLAETKANVVRLKAAGLKKTAADMQKCFKYFKRKNMTFSDLFTYIDSLKIWNGTIDEVMKDYEAGTIKLKKGT